MSDGHTIFRAYALLNGDYLIMFELYDGSTAEQIFSQKEVLESIAKGDWVILEKGF